MILKNVQAKGRCYQTAWRMFQNHHGVGTFLCHGIAVRTKPPHERMGRAWIEWLMPGTSDWFVFDGLYPETPIARQRYYEIGRVDPATVKRYTFAQAQRLFRDTRLYGPWDATISAAAHAGDPE